MIVNKQYVSITKMQEHVEFMIEDLKSKNPKSKKEKKKKEKIMKKLLFLSEKLESDLIGVEMLIEDDNEEISYENQYENKYENNCDDDDDEECDEDWWK